MTFYGVMTETSVKLLQAASEIVGGDRALARHLGVGEALLYKMLAGSQELPDYLLLRAVDIILADRDTQFLPGQMPNQSPAEEDPRAR